MRLGSVSQHKELKVIRGPKKDMEAMQERFETWNIVIFQQGTTIAVVSKGSGTENSTELKKDFNL